MGGQPQDEKRARIEGTAQEEAPTGFAVAMQHILGKDIGQQDPVLAKRHTASEKRTEKLAQEKKEQKERAKERKRLRRRAHQPPDPLDKPFERQLKRIATKGVVALFNAISQHQKQVAAAGGVDGLGGTMISSSSTAAGSAPTDKRLVPDVQKDKFLHLLDQEKEVVIKNPPKEGGAPRAGAGAGSSDEDEDEGEEDEGSSMGEEDEAGKFGGVGDGVSGGGALFGGGLGGLGGDDF